MTPPPVKREGARVLCTLTFAAPARAAAEEHALEHLGQQMDLKGFRPGKAPLSLVRERVKEDALFEETVRHLIQPELPKLVESEKLSPIIPPRVEVTSREPLTVQVTFVERPAVTVKGVRDIKIDRKTVTADPRDIDRVITSFLADHRTTTVTDRAAASGDQITIDFSAQDKDGQPVPGMSGQSYPVTIGSAHLLPGFEDQLIGLKAGEDKRFPITIPSSHPAKDLQGKTVTFAVKALTVEGVTLPALTDAFAKEKFHQNSAADLKKVIEQSILKQEQQLEDVRRERLLLEEIKKRTKVDLPQELIDAEVHELLEELAHDLQSRKITFEDFLKKEGKSAEEVTKDFTARARDRLTLRLGMAAVIEELQIELSQEELQKAVERTIVNLPPEQQAEARKTYAPGTAAEQEVRWRAMVEKGIGMLLKQ